MKLSAKGGQAKPVAANATGFNPWKFTFGQGRKRLTAVSAQLIVK